MAIIINGVERYCNVCIPCDATTFETVVAVGTEADVGDILTYQYLACDGGHCMVHYKTGETEKIVFSEPNAEDIRIVGGSMVVDSTHEMFVFCPNVTVYKKMYVSTYELCRQVQSLDDLVARLYEYGFTEDETQAAINQYFEASLRYTAIDIKSFSVSGNPAEKGRTINSVVLSWAANKVPKEVYVDGKSFEATNTDITLADLGLTSDKTWTLKVVDDFGASATKQTTLHFYNGVYYGAAVNPVTIDSVFVRSLQKKLTGTRKGTLTVTAGSGQYIWFAFPVALGEPTFRVGGFEGGFIDMGVISYTNMYGYTEKYKVWKSENTNLGTTTVVIE